MGYSLLQSNPGQPLSRLPGFKWPREGQTAHKFDPASCRRHSRVCWWQSGNGPSQLAEGKLLEFSTKHVPEINFSQAIATWFANEAKAIVGHREPDSPNHKVSAHKNNPGKQWNHRTVAAELHQQRLDVIKKKLVDEHNGEGVAAICTYTNAVSDLLKELTEEQKKECRDLTDIWNKAPLPKGIQQKWVWW